MSGYTKSTDTIAFNGFQMVNGGGTDRGDAFLVKFNSLGSRIWGTYYGGAGDENGGGVAFDPSGYIYLTGETEPTTPNDTRIADTSSYQPVYGGGTMDGFLVKFNLTGSRIWGTYIGGSAFDALAKIALDGTGNIYLTGATKSYGLSTTAPIYSLGVFKDVLLCKYNSAGVKQWAVYYGGSNEEYGLGVVCDDVDQIYVTGFTKSSNNNAIATGGAFQTNLAGPSDAFLAKFDSTGSRIWGAYYGGSGEEDAHGITKDNSANIYICGATTSADGSLPTTLIELTHQPGYGGGTYDGFMAKFNEMSPLPITLISFTAEATKDKKVMLKWSTASELNNDYFTIEHSETTADFNEIARVKGAGTSSQKLDYSTIDNQPNNGINYYRLKQADYNGDNKYSSVVSVKIMSDNKLPQLYPNPSSTGEFLFSLPQDYSGNTFLKIFDPKGKQLFFKEIILNEEVNSLPIDLKNFSSGLYCITLLNNGIQSVYKAIKE